jgi:hypothetical protein
MPYLQEYAPKKEIEISLQVGDLNLGEDPISQKIVKVCWRCGKEGHYKKQCISKSVKRGKGSYDAHFIEAKTFTNEGDDVYLSSSSTYADDEAWLVNLGASFHMTPHKEWFYEYEKYDGGDVFLGDDSTTKIIG